MREILFRGKRTDNGEWAYGSPIFQDGYVLIRFWNGEEFEFEEYLVSPETVGQFTGLTDKNGKKIFEGDIVKRDFTLWHGEKRKTSKTQIGVVSYSDTDCGFNLKNACNLRKPWDGDTLEIIGNIHDNPELLKGGG